MEISMSRSEKREYWCEGEGLKLIQKWVFGGLMNKDIIKKIDINPDTFYNWRHKYKELDRIITCKGFDEMEYIKEYNGMSGKGKDYTTRYYRKNIEVFWCNQCNTFNEPDKYVLGNNKCKQCNILNGRKYRRTEQGMKVTKEYASNYYKANKDKVYEMVYRRHNRVHANEYDYSEEKWRRVLEFFNHKCAYCGSGNDLQREHIVPVSKGGGYIEENIIPACRSCNMSKLDRSMEEWYKNYTHFDNRNLNKINQWVDINNKLKRLS